VDRSIACGVWAGIHEGERNLLDDPGVDGRIILNLIFRKWDTGNGQNLSGSGYGQQGGGHF